MTCVRRPGAPHLGHDQGPRVEFMDALHDCYAQDIAVLASDKADESFRDFYQDRLADYLMILYLWDALPGDLLTMLAGCAGCRAAARDVVCRQ